MSSGPRHSLEHAREQLLQLAHRLELPLHPEPLQGAVFAVGSIRRMSPTVGDIELLAPRPEGRDKLAERLAELFVPRGGLLMPPAGILGEQVMGVHPGFSHCRVHLFTGAGRLPVEIFRYDPGTGGNIGWLALNKSGTTRFVRFALTRYGQITGGRASEDGYPRSSSGELLACPTELDAFALCRLPWVPPQYRGEWIDRWERQMGRPRGREVLE